MNRIRKFFGLPSAERRLLLRTWSLLAQVRIWLWLTSFKKTRERIGHRTIEKQSDDFSRERLAWMVQAASKYVPGASCLPQALAMDVLMRSYGYPSNLRIGIAKDQVGKIEAHAWIESDGQVVIGGKDSSRFTPLSDLK